MKHLKNKIAKIESKLAASDCPYTAKNLKMHKHGGGVAWSVEILKNGKHIGTVENDGRGGANRYHFQPRQLIEEYKTYAKENFGGYEPEADLTEKLIAPLEGRKASKKIAYDSPAEAVGKAIKLLDYLPNGVASWVEAYAGDKSKADKYGKMVEKCVQMLGEVVAAMPNSMKYELVTLDKNNKWEHKKFNSLHEFIEHLKSKGIKQSGTQDGKHLRPELQGQPTFHGLLGPMHGGGGVVRYENQEAYNSLSS